MIPGVGSVARMPRCVSLLLIILLSSCTSPGLEETPGVEFADQELYALGSSGFEEAFFHRDVDLASYRSVVADPLTLDEVEITQVLVSGTTRRDWRITPERRVTFQKAWTTAMDTAFGAYDRSGTAARTLRVAAELTRVRSRVSSITGMRWEELPPGVTRGDKVDISIEIRVYDQVSDDLLAVVRDQRDMYVQQWVRANGKEIINLFDSWAALLEARMSGR